MMATGSSSAPACTATLDAMWAASTSVPETSANRKSASTRELG